MYDNNDDSDTDTRIHSVSVGTAGKRSVNAILTQKDILLQREKSFKKRPILRCKLFFNQSWFTNYEFFEGKKHQELMQST